MRQRRRVPQPQLLDFSKPFLSLLTVFYSGETARVGQRHCREEKFRHIVFHLAVDAHPTPRTHARTHARTDQVFIIFSVAARPASPEVSSLPGAAMQHARVADLRAVVYVWFSAKF